MTALHFQIQAVVTARRGLPARGDGFQAVGARAGFAPVQEVRE